MFRRRMRRPRDAKRRAGASEGFAFAATQKAGQEPESFAKATPLT
jgi:hypothetical protein